MPHSVLRLDLAPWVLLLVLRVKCYSCSHFTDEETEAWRSKEIYHSLFTDVDFRPMQSDSDAPTPDYSMVL